MDRWLAVPFGSATLRVPYAGSAGLDDPPPSITRAVVVIHGTLRNADTYYADALAAANAAGADPAHVLVVVPQFLAAPDAAAFHLSPDIPYWTPNGWKDGARATSPSEGPSSFDVLDALLRVFANRDRFPALRTVVVAGHSAGGQLVQRYAAVGRADGDVRAAGVLVRYIVANPSSYLYFDDRRVMPDGTLATYPAAGCPEFNRYKYGLEAPNDYIGTQDGAALLLRYASRDVTYLLGGADTDPHGRYVDTTCAAEAQGASRLERGERFFRYLHIAVGPQVDAHQRLDVIPGVGHDAGRIWGSACGLRQLFGEGAC